MDRDLNILIDDKKLNIRVGIILKYEDEILVEISKCGLNSVIPGGRVKLLEKSLDAIKREIVEETGITLNSKKIVFNSIIENMFSHDDTKYHEIYFVYKYKLSKKEYIEFSKINYNRDNDKTMFKFIKMKDLYKVNLLPCELLDLI